MVRGFSRNILALVPAKHNRNRIHQRFGFNFRTHVSSSSTASAWDGFDSLLRNAMHPGKAKSAILSVVPPEDLANAAPQIGFDFAAFRQALPDGLRFEAPQPPAGEAIPKDHAGEIADRAPVRPDKLTVFLSPTDLANAVVGAKNANVELQEAFDAIVPALQSALDVVRPAPTGGQEKLDLESPTAAAPTEWHPLVVALARPDAQKEVTLHAGAGYTMGRATYVFLFDEIDAAIQTQFIGHSIQDSQLKHVYPVLVEAPFVSPAAARSAARSGAEMAGMPGHGGLASEAVPEAGIDFAPAPVSGDSAGYPQPAAPVQTASAASSGAGDTGQASPDSSPAKDAEEQASTGKIKVLKRPQPVVVLPARGQEHRLDNVESEPGGTTTHMAVRRKTSRVLPLRPDSQTPLNGERGVEAGARLVVSEADTQPAAVEAPGAAPHVRPAPVQMRPLLENLNASILKIQHSTIAYDLGQRFFKAHPVAIQAGAQQLSSSGTALRTFMGRWRRTLKAALQQLSALHEEAGSAQDGKTPESSALPQAPEKSANAPAGGTTQPAAKAASEPSQSEDSRGASQSVAAEPHTAEAGNALQVAHPGHSSHAGMRVVRSGMPDFKFLRDRSIQQMLARERFESVKSQIFSHISKDKSDVLIRLKPERLGNIRLALAFEDGSMKATFNVSVPETRALLESGLQTLRQALSEHGIRADHIQITLNSHLPAPLKSDQPDDAEHRSGQLHEHARNRQQQDRRQERQKREPKDQFVLDHFI